MRLQLPFNINRIIVITATLCAIYGINTAYRTSVAMIDLKAQYDALQCEYEALKADLDNDITVSRIACEMLNNDKLQSFERLMHDHKYHMSAMIKVIKMVERQERS